MRVGLADKTLTVFESFESLLLWDKYWCPRLQSR